MKSRSRQWSSRTFFFSASALLLISLAPSIGRAQFDPASPPPPAPRTLLPLLGAYTQPGDTLIVFELNESLNIRGTHTDPIVLQKTGERTFTFMNERSRQTGTVSFDGASGARPRSLLLGGERYDRKIFDGEDGNTFTIRPLFSQNELRRRARAAHPPKEKGSFHPSDLVELHSLDSTIRYDIRYATENNFMKQRFYSRPEAYLQRPAAEAFVRAHRWLASFGYGLLVHDAYRPWRVTKMFWDATPREMKTFVANPADGSRHNRGCAADVTLFDLSTGRVIEMVSGYDEFSERAFPEYPGGTTLQRWHRHLLRTALEREGFTVYAFEWWHFDYRDWRSYGIGIQDFDELR